MAIKDLFEVQVGSEDTWGTAVAGTAKLAGITDISMKPIVESERVKDLRGSLAPAYMSNLLKTGAEATIEGVVTYEDLPYWLDSLCGLATPTGANPYTYDYSAPLGTAPTVRDMTVIYGDGTNEYKMAGGVVKTLTISGEKNGTLEFSADMLGKAVSTGTTAALSDRTVNVALGNHVALYIDALAGTIGSTAVAATAFTFELEIESNRELIYHLGDIAPSGYTEGRWEGTLTLSLELLTASKAYIDAVIGASAVFGKLIRIKATSGTKIVQLDFAGIAEKSPEIFTDEDGIVTIELELKGQYDSGPSNWFEASVTNAVSALP